MGRGPFLNHWWPSPGHVLTWPKWTKLSECLLRYSAQCVEQGERGSLNQYAIQLSCVSTYSETAPGFIGLGFRSAKLVFSPTHSPLSDHSWKLVILTDPPQIRGCHNPSVDFRCCSRVWIVVCTSDRLTVNHRPPRPLPQVQLIC